MRGYYINLILMFIFGLQMADQTPDVVPTSIALSASGDSNKMQGSIDSVVADVATAELSASAARSASSIPTSSSTYAADAISADGVASAEETPEAGAGAVGSRTVDATSSGSTSGAASHAVPILRFYIDGGLDPLDRTHDEMLNYTDERMEECHDYVQWMWPLHEPSMFAQVYPVLDERVVEALAASAVARGRAQRGLARFRSFYGVEEGDKVDKRKVSNWCHNGDHNLLRITRIIRSLRLFGLDKESEEFWKDMTAVGEARGLSSTTLRYWQRAATEPPMAPLRESSNGWAKKFKSSH